MTTQKLTSLLFICILLLTACEANTSQIHEPETVLSPAEESTTDDQASTTHAPEASSEVPTFPITSMEGSSGTPVTPINSMEFVANMGTGWNLGNSFDPVDCTWLTDEMDYETAWGNQKVTRELIHYIKDQGFDTIRIPVTWTNHVSAAPDYIISSAWLDRVQEVVDWCMAEDLYVIINIHHESGWLTKASTDYDGTMTKYRAIWMQLADRFGDYSDKLLFESMNEIGFDDLGTEQGCMLMNRINGEFRDLIRNSGQNNGDRYLLLAGYWTDIDSSCQGIVMPSDDKVILSVHYYSPSDFAIAEAGTGWGYRATWGTEEDFAYMEGQFEKLKTTFLDKEIPVIMGEFGCIIKDKDPQSRILYLSSIADSCRQYGICPVFWDNGEEIDRANLSWRTDGLAKKLLGEESEPDFPQEITMIKCLEFDESVTEYTDATILEAIADILHQTEFTKLSEPEYYIGSYMFEFYENEMVHTVGISRDHFIYDGECYLVDETINNEILKLLGKMS